MGNLKDSMIESSSMIPKCHMSVILMTLLSLIDYLRETTQYLSRCAHCSGRRSA